MGVRVRVKSQIWGVRVTVKSQIWRVRVTLRFTDFCSWGKKSRGATSNPRPKTEACLRTS